MVKTLFKFDSSDKQITNMESLLEEASVQECDVVVFSDGEYTYIAVEDFKSKRFDAHKVQLAAPLSEYSV